MKEINKVEIPESPNLILVTTVEVYERAKLYAADFTDIEALYHDKLDRWIGFNNLGLRFATNSIKLVNGLWFSVEDSEMLKTHPKHKPAAEDLVLKIIK